MKLGQAKLAIDHYLNSVQEKMPLQRVVTLGSKMYVASIDIRIFGQMYKDQIAMIYQNLRHIHKHASWHKPNDDMRLAFAKVFDTKAKSYDPAILKQIREKF